MGISCGALQWNIGSNSSSRWSEMSASRDVLSVMPHFGGQMWQACNSTVSVRASPSCAGGRHGTRLKPKPKAELVALMGSTRCVPNRTRRSGQSPPRPSTRPRRGRPARGGAKSKRLFCWFFDIVTQNGGLEGLTFAKTKNFHRCEPARPGRRRGLRFPERPKRYQRACQGRKEERHALAHQRGRREAGNSRDELLAFAHRGTAVAPRRSESQGLDRHGRRLGERYEVELRDTRSVAGARRARLAPCERVVFSRTSGAKCCIPGLNIETEAS